MRGYELAEKLGVDYSELKEKASEEGYELGHHMSDVDEEVIELLESIVQGEDGKATADKDDGKEASTETKEKPRKKEKTEKAEKAAEPKKKKKKKSKEKDQKETSKKKEKSKEKEKKKEPKEAETKEEEEEEEESARPKRMRKSELRKKKGDGKQTSSKKKTQKQPKKKKAKQQKGEVHEITPPASIRDVSEQLGIQSNRIIKLFMQADMMKTINDRLNRDDLELLGSQLNKNIKIVEEKNLEEQVIDELEAEEDEPEDLEPRAPVVTVLGHVDHGKTSILDQIRESQVAEGEAGGITQKVGASRIFHDGDEIIFLDTPGHEAFTSMRARGADVTDLVVLVVAADDGVMPQTEESVNHAKAAGVPILVAINKIDKPNADPMRTRQQVSELDLIPEDWGGETVFVNTSAETGEGIDELLNMISLESELLELSANPDKEARGACLESTVKDQQGVTTTLLVQEGTLNIGDVILCGESYGKIRAMFNDRGNNVDEAGPSTPVVVLGLNEPPEAGEPFYIVEDEQTAREIVEDRKEKSREESLARQSKKQKARLSNVLERLDEEEEKHVNLIVKAGSDGACEVLVESLQNMKKENAVVQVLHSAVGSVTESDILLADASDAIVIGFQTGVEARARQLAEETGIEIRTYEVIYKLLEQIENALLGVLEPEIVQEKIGQLNVKETFNITGVGKVAGCYVASGKITNDAVIQVYREKEQIYEGEVESLKRFQEDQKEVQEGYECGVRIQGFDDLQVGDILQAYKEEEVLKTAETAKT